GRTRLAATGPRAGRARLSSATPTVLGSTRARRRSPGTLLMTHAAPKVAAVKAISKALGEPGCSIVLQSTYFVFLSARPMNERSGATERQIPASLGKAPARRTTP